MDSCGMRTTEFEVWLLGLEEKLACKDGRIPLEHLIETDWRRVIPTVRAALDDQERFKCLMLDAYSFAEHGATVEQLAALLGQMREDRDGLHNRLVEAEAEVEALRARLESVLQATPSEN